MIAVRSHDPLLDEIARLLVERFDAERVILFGSRARGDHDADSDYDILIVSDRFVGGSSQQDAARAAASEILRTRIGRPVDIIACTTAEFERRRHDVGTLVYVCLVEGRTLYDGGAESPGRVREPGRSPHESLRWWLERAMSDFAVMEREFLAVPIQRDAVVFHAHQGVEKLIKAALVRADVPPPRTHNLSDLLDRFTVSLRAQPRLQTLCRDLDDLWPKTRYPDHPMPTPDEVNRAVACARRARAILSSTTAPTGSG